MGAFKFAAEYKNTDMIRLQILRTILIVLLSSLFALPLLAQENGTLVFHETFDQFNSVGGCDGVWGGFSPSPSMKKDGPDPDNTGWTYYDPSYIYRASKCMQIGTRDAQEIQWAKTPAIPLTGDATIVFRAAAWNTESEVVKIKIDTSSGKLSQSDFTLQKGVFKEYTVVLTGVKQSAKIKFSCTKKDVNRFFLDDVAVYASEAPDPSPEKQSPELSFTPAALSVNLGEEFEVPVLSNPHGLTGITYNSSSEQVAKVDAASGDLAIVGAGTTTITAKFSGNDAYEAGSASYTLTVKKPDAGGEEKPGGGDPSEEEFLTSSETISLTKKVDPSQPIKGHAATLKFVKLPTATFPPAWNETTNLLHVYAQNTITVSSPLKITGIKIVYMKTTTANVEKLHPNVGKCKYAVPFEKKYLAVVWSGESNEVVFTHTGSSGVFHLLRIEVTFSAPALTVPAIATREGYTTFYSDKSFIMPVGLEGTAVGYDGRELVMDWAYPSGSVVPASTPLLLRGKQGESYPTSVVTENADTPPAGNLLVGTLTDETPVGEGKYYLLTYSTINGEEVLGFYLKSPDGSAFVNKAGKACLRLAPDVNPSALKGFTVVGVPTAVEGVISETATQDRPVYTLSGRPVTPSLVKSLPAGVYIRDGKKFIVR